MAENDKVLDTSNTKVDETTKVDTSVEASTTTTETTDGVIDYESKYKEELAKNELLLAREKALITLVPTPNAIDLLSEEEQTKLYNLRDSDPEAWRVEVNRLEAQESNVTKDTVNKVTEVATLAHREALLNLQIDNPNSKITGVESFDDIPTRITRDLENGTINFEEFLVQANKFLNGTVKGEVAPTIPKTVGTNETMPPSSKGVVEEYEENTIF